MSSVLAKELAERAKEFRTTNMTWDVTNRSFGGEMYSKAEVEKALAEFAAALIDSALPKWVKVSERLPEKGQLVWIAYGDTVRLAILAYDGEGCGQRHKNHADCDCGNWWWSDEEGDTIEDVYTSDASTNGFSAVTHWMEYFTPAAPSTDEKEGSRG